jgi:hypothetical protein
MSQDLNYLKDVVHKTLEKATSLNQEYSQIGKQFDECIKLRLNEVLRKNLIREINEITEPLFKEANEKQAEIDYFRSIQMFPNHKSRHEKEVWIAGFISQHTNLPEFSAEETDKAFGPLATAEMQAKYSNLRYMPLDEFRKRVEILYSSISSGKLDHILKKDGRRVLLGIMGNSRLI